MAVGEAGAILTYPGSVGAANSIKWDTLLGPSSFVVLDCDINYVSLVPNFSLELTRLCGNCECDSVRGYWRNGQNLGQKHAPILSHLTEIFPYSLTYHRNMPPFGHILQKYASILSHLTEKCANFVKYYRNIPLLCHISQKHALIMSYNTFAPAPAPTRSFVPIFCFT